jgi:hypothetical protein
MVADDITSTIDALIRQHADRVAAARERACEVAVQSGCYGVLETCHPNGDVTFDVTADVPYGCRYVVQK